MLEIDKKVRKFRDDVDSLHSDLADILKDIGDDYTEEFVSGLHDVLKELHNIKKLISR